MRKTRHDTAGRPVILEAGHRAYQGVAVGAEGERTVDHFTDTGIRQRRKAAKTFLERVGQPVERGRQKLGGAIIPRCPLDRPWRGLFLVDAEKYATLFLAQIDLAIEIEHQRHLGLGILELGKILGEQIMMLHGHDGQIDARHETDLARPQAARIDHMLRDDRAAIRDHEPAVRGVLELDDPGVPIDLGAVEARRLRKRMGGAARIQVSLQRVEYGSHHRRGVDQRTELGNFPRTHEPGVETEYAVTRPVGAQQFPALLGRSHVQTAREVQPDVLAGKRLEFPVEPHRVGLQFRDVGIAVERVKAARRMPARARGQLLALAEHDIGPAELGQVKEHTATDDAAPDDERLNVRFHGAMMTAKRAERSAWHGGDRMQIGGGQVYRWNNAVQGPAGATPAPAFRLKSKHTRLERAPRP